MWTSKRIASQVLAPAWLAGKRRRSSLATWLMVSGCLMTVSSGSVFVKDEAACESVNPKDESRILSRKSLETANRMVNTLSARINIAPFVDHTKLNCDATPDDIRKLCHEAVEYGFCSVCVNGSNVKLAREILNSCPENDVKVCAVVGFPLGASDSSVKAFETLQVIHDGAQEVDMVVNVGRVKAKDWNFVARDISAVANICKKNKVVCKVILETCLLTDEEKKEVIRISVMSGADFVKTSTGFSTGGANVKDVRFLYHNSQKFTYESPTANPGDVQVKASGGIKTTAEAVEMLRNGATRIGASRAVQWCSGETDKKSSGY